MSENSKSLPERSHRFGIFYFMGKPFQTNYSKAVADFRKSDTHKTLLAGLISKGIAEKYALNILHAAFDQGWNASGVTVKPINHPSSEEKWWQVLGVPKNSSEDEVKEAYLSLAKKHHPDAGGTTEGFQRIVKAFENYYSE